MHIIMQDRGEKMAECIWIEDEKEFKTIEHEVWEQVEGLNPESVLNPGDESIKPQIDEYLKGLNKQDLKTLSGMDIVEVIEELSPISFQSDNEILEHKLKPWHIKHNYVNLDVMGLVYEIGEVLNAFNVIGAIPVLFKINDILVRRTYRDMQPCQSIEDFREDLKANPGARIKWAQIGD